LSDSKVQRVIGCGFFEGDMNDISFLTGLNGLQMRMLDICRVMSEDEKVFIEAKDFLQVFTSAEWDMDDETFEEECESLECHVESIDDYPIKSVGYAFRLLLLMGLPWRCRYPYFDLVGAIGDYHDEIPFGPSSVELRLSKYTNILLPTERAPLLPIALLNGLSLADGTEIPAHNLEELWMAIEHLRQDPRIPLADLMEILPGPDFSAGGVVGGTDAIRKLYENGEGALTLRGQIDVEIEGGRTRIVIRSLPQGVLIKTVLDQISLLSAKNAFALYKLKDISAGVKVGIVMDVSPRTSSEQLKSILFRETDLEIIHPFRCGFKDAFSWSETGSFLSVLREAALQCPTAWKRKDDQASEVLPAFRDMMDHGGYKNPLSQLTDERRSRLLGMSTL